MGSGSVGFFLGFRISEGLSGVEEESEVSVSGVDSSVPAEAPIFGGEPRPFVWKENYRPGASHMPVFGDP